LSDTDSSYHAGIIFSDIQGFSKIKRTLVRKALHNCFEAFKGDYISTSNTFNTKNTGDGLVIFAKNAVAAATLAVRLRDHLRAFDWSEHGEVPHGLRIGVHFALIRQVESLGQVMDFLGSEIDTGARLEPVVPPGKAYCTEDVAAFLRKTDETNIGTRYIGDLELAKGYGVSPVHELVWKIELGNEVAAPSRTASAQPASAQAAPVLNRGGEDYIDVLTRMTCWNQGQIISHFYLAGERHKELRMAAKSKTEKRVAKLESFEMFLNNRIKSALRQNFEFAREVFTLRKGKGREPRFAFKYHYIEPTTKQLCIGSFNVGDADRYRAHFLSEVTTNTASLNVEDNGSYYRENNIPEAARNGDYVNPRLDPEKAKRYQNGQGNRDAKGPDTAWVACWRPWMNPVRKKVVLPPPESCYKSTLVVPCTLKNNTLVDASDFWNRLTKKSKFTELFRLRQNVDSDAVQRQIYAYFCMDFTEPGYFDEVFDVRIGYIVADILSLYFFINQTYTVLSETVRNIAASGAKQRH